MGLTRRNTIIGLGALAGGAGVIGATGAFTSVEADRTIAIDSSGDGSANVEIVVDPDDKHDSLSDAGNNTVSLSFTGLNQNAITNYADALQVNPTGSNGNYDVTADVEDGSGSNVSWVTLTVNSGSGISAGTDVSMDLEIDLTNNEASDFPSGAVISISVTQSN